MNKLKKILIAVAVVIGLFFITATFVHAQVNTTQGGTGLSSYTAGDLLYFGSGFKFSKLGIGTNGQCLLISSGLPAWGACGGGGSGHVVQDEGTPLTNRANLNFVGAGVTVTDDSGNDASVVTIPGPTVDGSGTTDYLTLWLDSDTLSSNATIQNNSGDLEIEDKQAFFVDNTDRTKRFRFENVGITTGTDRIFTMPDLSGTIALLSNKLSDFASTTSSELAGVISDETGSGALVFGTSPTLTTPSIARINSVSDILEVGSDTTGNTQFNLTNDNSGASTSNTLMFKQGGTNRFQIQYQRTNLDVFLDTFTSGADIAVRPNSTEVARFTPTFLNLPLETASRILSLDASKNVTALNTTTYPSLTEFSYLKGVTSAVQTQLNGKLSSTAVGSSGQFIYNNGGTYTGASQLVFDATNVIVQTTPFQVKNSSFVTHNLSHNSVSYMGNSTGGPGRVGFGQVTSPTARIHIGAGSTSASTAPLKLTSGSLMTTPEAGAIEFLTDGLYYTNSTGTRRQVANLDGTQTLTNKTLTSPVLNTGVSGTALADASGINTGTSTTTLVTPDALAGSYAGTKNEAFMVASATYTLTTGDGKLYYRVPSTYNGMDIVSVACGVNTTSSSGTPTFQIARGRQASPTTAHAYVDVLSTRITIDANEYDSKDATTPAVINTSNDDVATGDILRFDTDVTGTGTRGENCNIGFRLP